jgi:hypothetical protein
MALDNSSWSIIFKYNLHWFYSCWITPLHDLVQQFEVSPKVDVMVCCCDYLLFQELTHPPHDLIVKFNVMATPHDQDLRSHPLACAMLFCATFEHMSCTSANQLFEDIQFSLMSLEDPISFEQHYWGDFGPSVLNLIMEGINDEPWWEDTQLAICCMTTLLRKHLPICW